MPSYVVLSRLASALGDYLEAGDTEVRFNCPLCERGGYGEDLHSHLYLNTEKELWTCFRCGEKGTARQLFRRLQLPYPSEQDGGRLRTSVSVLSTVRSRLDKKRLSISLPPIAALRFPCETRPVVPGSEPVPYLISRGIRQTDLWDAQLVWGTYKGADRIFFPTFDPTETYRMTFWSARAFAREVAGEEVKRYVNPPGADRSEVVFNLHRARRFPTVIITEGVISAMVAGANAVATFGKHVSLSQRLLLLQHRFDEYVLALDGDAWRETMEMAQFLLANECKTSIVQFGRKEDPASCDFQERLAARSRCGLSDLVRFKAHGI